MKKLMIAAAIALATVASQAATIKWNSGAIFGVADDKGTKASGADGVLKSNTSVSWYVFTDLTDAQYTSAQTAGTVYGWLSETPTGAAKLEPIVDTKVTQGTKSNGQMNTIQTDKYSGNDTVNWASVIVYDDGSKVWYTENYGTEKFDSIGSEIAKSNLAGKMAVGGATIGSWTAAQSVPEPTSGLLLVLGIAGLALRRRRA